MVSVAGAATNGSGVTVVVTNGAFGVVVSATSFMLDVVLVSVEVTVMVKTLVVSSSTNGSGTSVVVITGVSVVVISSVSVVAITGVTVVRATSGTTVVVASASKVTEVVVGRVAVGTTTTTSVVS